MSNRTTELKNQLTNILNTAESQGRDLTDAEQQHFNRLEAEYIKSQSVKPSVGASQTGWYDAATGKSVDVYGKGQNVGNGASESVGDVIAAMVRGNHRASEGVRNALSEGVDSAGGYTVPEHITRQFIDLMRSKSVTQAAGARTVMLDTQVTNIARLASDPAADWRAENAAITTSEPVFENVQFVAKSLAVAVPVSREVYEDSVNLSDVLMGSLAQAMALKLDQAALFGDGTGNSPVGLINTAGIETLDMGVDGAAISSYAPLLSAWSQTAAQNAADPSAIIMPPRSYFALAGLVDTQGQPLRKPEVLTGVPMLHTTSLPVDETKGTSTDASKIVLGDFSQLMIGMRSRLRIELMREPLAMNHQLLFIAHLRADVAVAQPKSFCVIDGVTA